MSYAVIKTGGKQYKVKSGEILKIEKLPDSKPESKIEFNEVLAYGDDKTIESWYTYSCRSKSRS
jgi:large subunit ribosomal protein L21